MHPCLANYAGIYIFLNNNHSNDLYYKNGTSNHSNGTNIIRISVLQKKVSRLSKNRKGSQ
jgi:hypothetical protein